MFRVLVISISLKNNQIANSKDEVSESLFSAPIAELVDGGYIEEVTESKDEVAENRMEALKQDLLNKESDDDFEEDEPSKDIIDISDSIPGAQKPNNKKK